jgi:hypothetical protein
VRAERRYHAKEGGLGKMAVHRPLVAYVGPDTVLPLASTVAAVVGAVLVFWGYLVSLVKKAFKFLVRKGP